MSLLTYYFVNLNQSQEHQELWQHCLILELVLTVKFQIIEFISCLCYKLDKESSLI